MERTVTFLTVSEKSSGQTLTGLCCFIAEKYAMAKRMLHCDRPCMVTPYLEWKWERWISKGNLGRRGWILCRKKKKKVSHNACFSERSRRWNRYTDCHTYSPSKIKSWEFRDEDSRRILANHEDRWCLGIFLPFIFELNIPPNAGKFLWLRWSWRTQNCICWVLPCTCF